MTFLEQRKEITVISTHACGPRIDDFRCPNRTTLCLDHTVTRIKWMEPSNSLMSNSIRALFSHWVLFFSRQTTRLIVFFLRQNTFNSRPTRSMESRSVGLAGCPFGPAQVRWKGEGGEKREEQRDRATHSAQEEKKRRKIKGELGFGD